MLVASNQIAWNMLPLCMPHDSSGVLLTGLILYFMDVAFRIMQQAQCVTLSRSQVAANRSLITLHMPITRFTPIRPVQVSQSLCRRHRVPVLLHILPVCLILAS